MFRKLMGLIIAQLFLAPHSTVPATAKTLTGMSAEALRKQAWDKTLREDHTLDDCFSRLSTVVDVRVSNLEVPNAIFMEFETPSTDTHRMTFGMSAPLKKAFQMGTDEDMLANEEDLDLMHLTSRYNEIKE